MLAQDLRSASCSSTCGAGGSEAAVNTAAADPVHHFSFRGGRPIMFMPLTVDTLLQTANHMISIKKNIELLDIADRRATFTRGILSRTLAAIQRAAELVAEEAARPFCGRIEAARNRLENEASDPTTLCDQVLSELEPEIQRFADDFKYDLRTKDNEYKSLVRIIAEAAATASRTGYQQQHNLRELVRKVESVNQLRDIVEIRSQIAKVVSELKTMSDEVQQGGENQARLLREEMEKVQQRLQEVESLAETDPLTGLANRRKAEAFIRDAVRGRDDFSALLFDLDGFKQINDRFGHLQGDLFLKNVAGLLHAAVRKTDLVCRLGGDEFLLILRGSTEAEAAAKGKEIQSNIFGDFILDVAGRSVRVKVGASLGVTQYRQGDSLQDIVDRADRLMYEDKSLRKKAHSPNNKASTMAVSSAISSIASRDVACGGTSARYGT